MPYSDRPKGYREILAEEQTAFWGDLYTWAIAQALDTLGKRGAPVNYNTQVNFDAFPRSTPYNKNAFAIAAGQYITAEHLDKNWRPTQDQIDALAEFTMKEPDSDREVPLFERDFLERVRDEPMELSVDMMDEGRLIFGHVPFANISGKMGQAVRAEVAFLNAFNSQSLFATKAARLKIAANQKPVTELGVRRAHSIGGKEETRGAYIGGIDATSSMQGWWFYKMPMFGSQAHAWIMLHESERVAFENMARVLPQNFAALLDTFDTLEGARNAVAANETVSRELGRDHLLKSVRLDSGNMIWLSNRVSEILKQAGIREKVKIWATSDLDEKEIMDLEREGSVDGYGVGTKLVTSTMQPAMGAVYKLSAAQRTGLTPEMLNLYEKARASNDTSPEALGRFMRDVIKLGERPQPGELDKATIPGRKNVIRTLTADFSRYNGDIIYPASRALPVSRSANRIEGQLTEDVFSVLINDPTRVKKFPKGTPVVLPLQPMFNHRGALEGTIGTIHDARKLVKSELAMLASDHKSLTEPYPYGVGIEQGLAQQRLALIAEHRGYTP